MKKYLIFSIFAASFVYAAAETPLWMRDAVISPDGKQIAFSYKGDIYKVAANGGQAVRLTSQPSYESKAVWSPDGKQIAFASDRNGDFDVYIMNADGGTAKRITSNSANEMPQSFTPDGKFVVYSAAIQAPATSAAFPTGRLVQIYEVPVAGGGSKQILGTAADMLQYVPGTKNVVYQDIKGFEDKFRKHHTSSVTRDIWLYNSKTGKHTNLTNHAGEDLNPVVSADGGTLYFLTERDGKSMNIWQMPLSRVGDSKALTDFQRHPVRFLSVSNNGTLAFTYDGEIYTMMSGGTPKKVEISVVGDDADRQLKYLTASSTRDAAPSPDGKQYAYVNRGEVFVTSVDFPSVKQVTHTVQGESNVTWGKDSRELYYTSERDGYYNIYRASIARPDDPNFSNATVINEERVFPDDKIDRTYPSISPDGKKIAFVQDRNKLMVMDLASKKTKQLTDGTTNPSRTKGFYSQWSPDGKMLLIENTKASHQPYSDISVIDVESGKIHDITNTGYFDQSPRWALDGNAILFLSERYGMRNHASWGSHYDAMLAFLTQDAYDKFRLSEEDYALLKDVEKQQKKKAEAKKDDSAKKDDKKSKSGKKSVVDDSNKSDDESKKSTADESKKIDFENIELRTVRLTPASSEISDAYLTADGDKLYFLSGFEDGYDMWETDVRKNETKLVKKLGIGPGGMEPDKDGNLYIVSNSVKKFTPKSSKFTNITLGGRFPIDLAAEREYMLHHVYNEERERFYVKDMNGVDWDGLYKDYARFLPHINNNRDYADLLSELLGELNVSHTGGRYRGTASDEPTAQLGLLYDMSYAGPGLKVAEIVANGPFDRATTQLKPGSVIVSVNGEEISADKDISSLLSGVAKKKTLVGFKTGGKYVEEVVLPITSGKFSDLLYDRWVSQREKDVEKWSNGRLGYVHLEAMDDSSFRRIYAKVMGKYRDLEGIVIDTRWNGGGRLHEDIEVLFSAEPYLTQDIHGMVTSVMPSRRWTKPSIMVIGEANYSNAHGTPWVYKHKNLGKLVGMPVPGTMSSVNWVTLQDPSLVFGIPVIGFRTSEGNYLENTQLEPDVKIANDPVELEKGNDQQLKRAVEELLQEIDGKK